MIMSDRIYSYTVILDNVYKDEDAEQITAAIRMIKGVSSVMPQVADTNTYFAMDKARNELGNKIFELIHPSMNKG